MINAKEYAISHAVFGLVVQFTRGFYGTNESLEVTITDINIEADTFEAKAVGYVCDRGHYATATVSGHLVHKRCWRVPITSLSIQYGIGDSEACKQSTVRAEILPDEWIKFWWKASPELPDVLLWETVCLLDD